MQITLIRHGKYDESNGRLSTEGIQESILAGLLLGNAVNEKLPDFVSLDKYGLNELVPVTFLQTEYQEQICAPDLIITSSSYRTKETGFVISEQLKKMGINPSVQNDVVYLNELNPDSYKINNHERITSENLDTLINNDNIQKTIDFIKRLGQEGKKHVVIISHQPNIHVLLGCLSKDFISKAPENGVVYTVLSVDPSKIGTEKYPAQKRFIANDEMKRVYLKSFSILNLPVDVDDIKKKMFNFNIKNKVRTNGRV